MIPVTFIWIMLILISVGMPIVFALGAAPMIGLILADKEFFLAIIAENAASELLGMRFHVDSLTK